jgi:hypothetical protein
MIPTWRDVNVAIRDLDAPAADTDDLLLATELRRNFPLHGWESVGLHRYPPRPDPVSNTDAAITWAGAIIPGARLQFWNQAAGGGWCATVTCRAEGVEAQAIALTLPFALIKATVEARVDLDFLSAPDPS